MSAGWREWATATFQEKLGRAVAVLVGVGCTIGGALPHHPGARDVALVTGGVILVASGTMLPHIKRFWLPGGGIETREERDVGQLGEAVESLRTGGIVDIESVDLPGNDYWDGARFAVGEQAVSWLLEAPQGDLAGCEARIFLYDEFTRRLMPAFRPATSLKEPLGWAIGQGVTGAAYQNGERVLATGDATHDETHGLLPKQRARYADLTAVAAAPLFDRELHVIGTLSLSSKAQDTMLGSDEAEWQHIDLAAQVSVVLVDLLHVNG